MTWIKQGIVFNLNDGSNRSNHTQCPTPYVMQDRIRVYYSCRNNGCSFPAFFDLSKDLKTVLKVYEQPIMDLGNPGEFDSDGIMPGCIIENDNELQMYYTGWNEKSKTARYHNAIGLAVSIDGGLTFKKKFKGPILDRNHAEPDLHCTPFVIKDNNKFKMWYSSGTGWDIVCGKWEPTYEIKYAESGDGVEWNRESNGCLAINTMKAYNHPSILFNEKINIYNMWYCERDSYHYRNGVGSYKIKHALSHDGINFKEGVRDVLIAEDNQDAFDSNMQAYPYIFNFDDKLIMMYNGNGFGQTGIGVAAWE